MCAKNYKYIQKYFWRHFKHCRKFLTNVVSKIQLKCEQKTTNIHQCMWKHLRKFAIVEKVINSIKFSGIESFNLCLSETFPRFVDPLMIKSSTYPPPSVSFKALQQLPSSSHTQHPAFVPRASSSSHAPKTQKHQKTAWNAALDLARMLQSCRLYGG